MGIAETFKVLADPQRREILEILKSGRQSAGDLAAGLGISAPAMSYHLRLLKGAELVLEYREKNFVYYELNATVFDEIVLWVRQFAGSETMGGAGADSAASASKEDNHE